MLCCTAGIPKKATAHSDLGSQFGSRKFCRAPKRYGLQGPMGACEDHAAMESFFSLSRKNLLDRQAWAGRQELQFAIVAWI